MLAQTITVVGAVNGSPVVLDYLIAPFQVSVGVSVVSGSVNYTLQYTYDDPFAAAGITNWFSHSLMTGLTAAGDAVINGGPVMAIRINNAGPGTLPARIIQAGK